ncbi:MAG: 30S ribosomal protein S16 [Lachnospiraceae bacterium]|nr:30S ribosomal protein S16 [Lachnospiraceae bacterium]MCR5778713.1 30S ribosomal protein S16 [Lachnospiraceae bacterium]
MVKIRLKRIGKKKAPFYRIVVTDAAASCRTPNAIENIGTYDPLQEPAAVKIDEELAKKWLKNGAQPTETVTRLFKNAGILQK